TAAPVAPGARARGGARRSPSRCPRARVSSLDRAPRAGAGWRAMTTQTAETAATPVEIARALAPRVRARADEIETGRQLPKDLVLEIAQAGLFKVGVPEAEGGLGADIVTTLEVIEENARAQASAGCWLAKGRNAFRAADQ